MSAGKKLAETDRAQPVNLRMRPDTKALIDRAASKQGKSRSEFVVDAARRAAVELLLDETNIVVSQEEFDWFTEVLNRPVNKVALQRLLDTPAPWER